MAGDIETEQFLFVSEQFVLWPLRQLRHRFRCWRFLFLQQAKERALSALAVGADARRARKRAVDLREERGWGFAEPIARARFDKRFEHLPVNGARIDAFAQVRERFEFFAFAARLQNALHGDFAGALDGGQAETNG